MNIYFILWVILFPISCSLCGYIDAKKKNITGENESYSDGVKAWSAAIQIFIWAFVGYELYMAQ